MVHVAPGLLEPGRGALFGPEEEVVHGNDAAAVDLLQEPGQGALARTAPPIDGHHNGLLPAEQPLYFPKHREKEGKLPLHHPVSWSIGCPKARAVAELWAARLFILLQEGEILLIPLQKLPEHLQLAPEALPASPHLLGCEHEESIHSEERNP